MGDWVDNTAWDPCAQGSGKKKWSTLPASCASWSRQQYHIRSLSESKTTNGSQQLEQHSSPPENLMLVFVLFKSVITYIQWRNRRD